MMGIYWPNEAFKIRTNGLKLKGYIFYNLLAFPFELVNSAYSDVTWKSTYHIVFFVLK